jgi:hypothetical protein
MATLLCNDDAIWFKHIDADSNILALLSQLPAGTRIAMNIEGITGSWQRMADGKDGRPTLGLKPVGATVEAWKKVRAKRSKERLNFRIIAPGDTYLSAVEKTLSEWHSKEDEKAFRDL